MKNWPITPPMKITGAKIDTSESVAASTPQGDLAAAVHRRRNRIGIEVLAVAEDVLEHHDRVVHHDADQQQGASIVTELKV